MPDDDALFRLTAISPLDGRYRNRLGRLRGRVSEFALMRYRLRVEIAWFIHLADCPAIAPLPPLTAEQRQAATAIWRAFDDAGAARVQQLEAQTNHDVKALEYYVKECVAGIAGLEGAVEFVHFACTSEDINNLAYGLMLTETRDQVLTPAMQRLTVTLARLAGPLTDVPMLSRTHGQAASPTTVGKELANVVARLGRLLEQVCSVAMLGKMNGAVGNYNAHVAAFPKVDWPALTRDFVEGLGLAFNPMTTQIEPHDYIAELLHAVSRFNQVVLDFDRDIWGYIALGIFKQHKAEGETGSSTMPHKVNPIDFENSEGNVGIANALLGHLADKLAVSRWQRDLSDSTALRNVGTAFGHCLLAYDGARRGIGKLAVDRTRLAADLAEAWEVLAEPVQTVMRTAGSMAPYEQLKALTRGERLDAAGYGRLLDELELDPVSRGRLAALSPDTYLGLASALAQAALEGQRGPLVREVDWFADHEDLRGVRRAVFVEEQGVPEAEEWDGQDPVSRHFLAEDESGRVVGTARLMPTGQIGRMAVLAESRGLGIGAKLLEATVRVAKQDGHWPIFLEAQTHAIGFYERAGFVTTGDEFMEAGIPHRRMEKAP